MIADFVVSVSRKVEDKIANTSRFHVIKNRFGIDGVTFPASMNTNIGKIQIYESTTQSGREVQGKMDNSQEYLRKQLSQKHQEFQKDVDGFEQECYIYYIYERCKIQFYENQDATKGEKFIWKSLSCQKILLINTKEKTTVWF